MKHSIDKADKTQIYDDVLKSKIYKAVKSQTKTVEKRNNLI